MQKFWTEDEITILRDNWNKMPCRELGKLLNRDKNSVIGKAHRLGLERFSRPARVNKPKPQKKAKSPIEVVKMPHVKKRVPRGPTFLKADTPLTGLPPIGIMELTTDRCKSVVGYGLDGLATYCGDYTFPGKSYCPTHCALYYREPEARRRA